ncbi:NAD(P)H-dependent oxidoreductase [Draconibacterium sp. IB214405]|uniref:NAD(P)H-dependent oxidoreductase n=1 Tax=Draconibacterium sp. IB214405 TaxID=3097352 RepID=UPI002A0D1A3F|nr:NAD(P)H-dependent oxidoreductase [Draconibacterium sp. IB214405]MDX8341291.1 NAD(P)H-dependent oxidoreductase [Draconibacterium sp. IB214405]
MKLAIFNGSPRGKTSNTNKLLNHFQNGFLKAGGVIEIMEYLIMEKHLDNQVQHFKEAENILLAFPLYVDSAPGVVKQFIEAIGNFDGSGKRIYFFIHSGFPEAIHSQGLLRYLEFLVKRWNINYGGTILKPGTEQIRMRPEKKNEKLFKDFEKLGSHLAENGELEKEILNKFKQPYVFSKRALPIVRLLMKLGVIDSAWNKIMKENRVLDRCFDTPLLS